MKIEEFDESLISRIYRPHKNSSGEDNGQVAIVGGSSLFHGAPILALKVASRIVDMVFFGTPEESVGRIAEEVKSKLMSFIWAPWREIESWMEKADSILIGPGFMRFRSERVPHGERLHACDEACQMTSKITKQFLDRFSNKKWVIDAGSLQVMSPEWIPSGAILTPNRREFSCLFNVSQVSEEVVLGMADKYKCTIVLKGPVTWVCGQGRCVKVKGGNPGLTKGGTGDVQAGLTVALLAKNESFLAASVAASVVKKAADQLYERVGVYFNADDVANEVPVVLRELVG